MYTGSESHKYDVNGCLRKHKMLISRMLGDPKKNLYLFSAKN